MHLRVRIAVTVKRGWSGACNVRESLCVRVHTRTHTHAHTHTRTHTHTLTHTLVSACVSIATGGLPDVSWRGRRPAPHCDRTHARMRSFAHTFSRKGDTDLCHRVTKDTLQGSR